MGYIADEELRGSLPFQRYVFMLLVNLPYNNNLPRSREEELLYVLRKLLNLHLWPGTLWAALSSSPSQYAVHQPRMYSLPHLYSHSHPSLQRLKPHSTQRVSSLMLSDGHPKRTCSTFITCSAKSLRSRARHHLPGFRHLQDLRLAMVGAVLPRKSRRKRRTLLNLMLVPSLENV